MCGIAVGVRVRVGVRVGVKVRVRVRVRVGVRVRVKVKVRVRVRVVLTDSPIFSSIAGGTDVDQIGGSLSGTHLSEISGTANSWESLSLHLFPELVTSEKGDDDDSVRLFAEDVFQRLHRFDLLK